MKHSRLLSTSILIALGLLLAIVKSASAQQNKPLPSSPNRQTTPQNDDQVRKRGEPEIPNPSFQAQAIEALKAITDERKAAHDQAQADEHRWWPPTADWAVVYVTVFYALIALGQLRSIGRQADLTDSSIQIAKAPHRPYLWIKEITNSPNLEFTEDIEAAYASCKVMNLGSGPAFITEVKARLRYARGNRFPSPPNFVDCSKCPILHPIVTESAPTNFIVMLKPDSVKNREGGAICYGIIRYRDVFGDFYTLTFGYQMLFSQINDDSPVMQGKFFLGPDEYNREPQKEK